MREVTNIRMFPDSFVDPLLSQINQSFFFGFNLDLSENPLHPLTLKQKKQGRKVDFSLPVKSFREQVLTEWAPRKESMDCRIQLYSYKQLPVHLFPGGEKPAKQREKQRVKELAEIEPQRIKEEEERIKREKEEEKEREKE